MTNNLYLNQPWIISASFIDNAPNYPISHSSTILATKQGGLLATWFGGSQRRAPDVKIYLARMLGGTWSEPDIVAVGKLPDGCPVQCWNPVLFEPEHGPIMLFYKVGPSPGAWWGMLKTSADQGRTWSSGQNLPTGFLGPIRNKPIQRPDGSLLCPGSTEGHLELPGWRIHFEQTFDLGKTWERISVPYTVDTPDAIQPSILMHHNGILQAIGRTKASRLFTTYSEDHGQTWSSVKLTEMPNPNSGIDAMTLRDGQFALVYNHNPAPAGLSPLNLAISSDGVIWRAAAILENDAGDYAYPSLTQSLDGLIHITYSWKFQKIKHVVIDPTKFQFHETLDGTWKQTDGD